MLLISPPTLPRWGDFHAILTNPLAQTLRHERAPENAEISILLCDDARIKQLNARHRGLDKPTDVLSFPMDDPQILGDIVISLPTARRQAQAVGWPPESELILLAVHGLLHLLGHDDETVAGAREMQQRTQAILTECGIMLPSKSAHPFFAEYK